MEYLAFVVVYNLRRRDYNLTGDIEAAVNHSLTAIGPEWVDSDKVIFSFPHDPSADKASAPIPVVVKIDLLKSTSTNAIDVLVPRTKKNLERTLGIGSLVAVIVTGHVR